MAGNPATAIGDIGMGTMGVLGSPLAGVKEGVAQVTGSPDIGESAANIVGLGLPVPKILSAVNEARPGVQGLNELVKNIPPEDIGPGLARLEANPRLSPADVFPSIRQQVQGLSITQGPWQGFLDQVSKQRGQDAFNSVTNATNTLGVSDTAYNTLNAIRERAATTGREAIQPALASGQPIPTSQVLESLDSHIGNVQGQPTAAQSQLLKLRDEIETNSGETISPDALHGMQSRLREDASTLSSSATGSDRLAGRDLMRARGDLVNTIDQYAPGYKDGLSQYRDDMQVREAFDKGLGVAKTRQGEAGILEDSPQAWQAWSKTASPDEMDAARAGALADLQRRVAQASKPVTAENIWCSASANQSERTGTV